MDKDANPIAPPEFAAPAPVSAPQPPTLKYDAPPFSRVPDASADSSGRPPAFFEVIKNGVVVETCPLASRGKEFLVAGRVPTCDVELEHPSISRLHAVLQFGPDDSVLLYDLDSAHHTFVNKNRAPPRTYVELHEGDQVRFGASTRVHVLQGRCREAKPVAKVVPAAVSMSGDDAESAAPSSVASRPVATTAEELHEVTWGFDEDAAEEGANGGAWADDDNREVDENAYYVKDPRKALRVWLEARGLQMEFEHEEDGKGHERIYVARIRLPAGDAGTIIASGTSSRKKLAEADACLDACAKLDRRNLLRSNEGPTWSKKRKAEDGDDLDDSSDNFYDRAAGSSKKKTANGKKAAVNVETFESLTAKKGSLVSELAAIRTQLHDARTAVAAAESGEGGEDELEGYLADMKLRELKSAQQKLESREAAAVKDLARTEKLLLLAKPVEFGAKPAQKQTEQATSEPAAEPRAAAPKDPQKMDPPAVPEFKAPALPSLLKSTAPSEVSAAPKPGHVREKESAGEKALEQDEEPQPAPAKRGAKRTFGAILPALEQPPASAPPKPRQPVAEDDDDIVDAVRTKDVDYQDSNSAYGY